VEELLRHLLESSHGLPAYLAIFGVLVACGMGVPLPEDISLITGGFLAYKGAVELWPMIAVGFAGILCGDSLIYLAGRRVGDRVERGKGFFARIVTPEKRARVEGLFARHGQKIVMLARFLPGVRAVTYFTAGSARMSYLRFIMFDGLAALASAPLITYLGFRFGAELDLVKDKVRDGQLAVIGALAAGVVGYLLFRRWRARREQAAAQPPSAVAPVAAAPAPVPAGSPERSSGPSVRVSDATSG
jgi:membrane protein DedA with SNARE-associated domain